MTEIWIAYARDIPPAHAWDGQRESSFDSVRLVRVARCGFLLDFGLSAYQWAGRETVGVALCVPCSAERRVAERRVRVDPHVPQWEERRAGDRRRGSV